jgi:excisionase family DNA binding protein
MNFFSSRLFILEQKIMEKQILVADEVAQLIRVDRQRVYSMVREKSIPFILLGQRQYRFSKQAIEKWLEEGGTKKEGEHNDSN